MRNNRLIKTVCAIFVFILSLSLAFCVRIGAAAAEDSRGSENFDKTESSISVVGAIIDDEGNLIVTLSDGRVLNAGPLHLENIEDEKTPLADPSGKVSGNDSYSVAENTENVTTVEDINHNRKMFQIGILAGFILLAVAIGAETVMVFGLKKKG